MTKRGTVRVQNPTSRGVYVEGHGALAPDCPPVAVPESEQLGELLAAGALVRAAEPNALERSE